MVRVYGLIGFPEVLVDRRFTDLITPLSFRAYVRTCEVDHKRKRAFSAKSSVIGSSTFSNLPDFSRISEFESANLRS